MGKVKKEKRKKYIYNLQINPSSIHIIHFFIFGFFAPPYGGA